MFLFSNEKIKIATTADTAAITALLNSAYRGEISKLGWTTEAHLIAGNVRTDEYNLQLVMNQPGSVVLKYSDQMHQLIGCVNLQQHGSKIYLGMFSVSPQLQGRGVGKEILGAAEEYAKYVQCKTIYMNVISVRKELIDWYLRRGFRDTGQRIPFKEDGLTGKHLQVLEFIIMEKVIEPT